MYKIKQFYRSIHEIENALNNSDVDKLRETALYAGKLAASLGRNISKICLDAIPCISCEMLCSARNLGPIDKYKDHNTIHKLINVKAPEGMDH